MTLTKPHFRLNQLVCATALVLAAINTPSMAQTQTDAPGRVARLSHSIGKINFVSAGDQHSSTLISNRPISNGDSLSVPSLGRAELHIGSTALRLNENTRIFFNIIDDDQTQIQLTQGTMIVHVRNLFEREIFEINTPNLRFSLQEPGEYRISVNYDNSTSILVRRGIGVAQGERDIITLREGEQTRFFGVNLNHGQIVRSYAVDYFDQWAADRNRQEENSTSARHVSREMIGYQELDRYGDWDNHSEYGSVWYPRVSVSNWAPYRDGKWTWIAPWGWTWVDTSPWGFTPYHYGRWAFVGHRWGWIPGKHHHHHRPIYAPALVAFVGADKHGIKTGVSITVGSSRSYPSVGWFPLGPHDVYQPSYHYSSGYAHRINAPYFNSNVTINQTNIYLNRTIRNAVTMIPGEHFSRGDYVGDYARPWNGKTIHHNQISHSIHYVEPAQHNRYGDRRQLVNHNDQFNNAKPRPDGSLELNQNGSGFIAPRLDTRNQTSRPGNHYDRNDRYERYDHSERNNKHRNEQNAAINTGTNTATPIVGPTTIRTSTPEPYRAVNRIEETSNNNVDAKNRLTEDRANRRNDSYERSQQTIPTQSVNNTSVISTTGALQTGPTQTVRNVEEIRTPQQIIRNERIESMPSQPVYRATELPRNEARIERIERNERIERPSETRSERFDRFENRREIQQPRMEIPQPIRVQEPVRIQEPARVSVPVSTPVREAVIPRVERVPAEGKARSEHNGRKTNIE